MRAVPSRQSADRPPDASSRASLLGFFVGRHQQLDDLGSGNRNMMSAFCQNIVVTGHAGCHALQVRQAWLQRKYASDSCGSALA